MQMRKKTIKKVLVAGGGSLLIIFGCAVILSQKPRHTDAEQVQEQGKTVAKSGVLGEAGVANNDEVSAKPQVASNSSNHTQTAPTPTASANAPSSTSSINNENGHETSSPPNDELVEINPQNTINPNADKGFIVGRVTTDVGGQACGFPAGFCTWPLSVKITAKTEGGTVVTTTQSANDGTYGFKLKPGKYILEFENIGEAFVAPQPKKVTVVTGQTVTADAYYEPMAMTSYIAL